MRRSCGWYNFNLGLMWNMNGNLTLGAVLKTPFTADVKHKYQFYSSLNVEGLPPVPPSTASSYTDIAYQYRFGRDVGSSILQGMEFSQDIEEHTVYSSIIYHY